MRTLFSCYGLHPRLQVIKLHSSLTYPLKITKGQPIPHPNTSHDLLLIDIQHYIGLSGCRWRLKLRHLELLLESEDRCCPLLELEVPLLDGVLEVYNCVGACVLLLMGKV
jgi:hypothetical protein